MSILERQKAIFNSLTNQNLLQFNSLMSENTMEFSQFQNFPIKIDTQMNFEREQRNSWSKKRKPELYEEDECKGKKHEEMTVKSEKGENSEIKKTDYIHVRARRGQATDSHSLAERARREKISKKMKCLQDLVPGCNKVIGKAGMLDEIINYVQSLQRQVEFLSIKLASSNLNTMTYPVYSHKMESREARVYADVTLTTSEEKLFSIDHRSKDFPNPSCLQMLSQRRENCLMSSSEAFLDSSHVPAIQQLPNFETDLQCLFGVPFQ